MVHKQGQGPQLLACPGVGQLADAASILLKPDDAPRRVALNHRMLPSRHPSACIAAMLIT